MKSMINRTHIEGLLYEHALELRTSGPNSKNPGTEFIMGTVSIATDDAQVNIVPVHFTYVTATTAKGTANATFGVLKDIIDGKLGTVMGNGADGAAKLRIDSAVGLNEFYTDRNGQEELVSAKRNEGGFIHTTATLAEDEKARNTFEVDIVITNVRRIEADEEKNIPEKAIVKGAIFDFRKSLMPVEFSVTNPNAMDYFEGLEASSKSPVFTKIKGRQVSETITRKIVEESAFGEDSVREVNSSRKDWVVTWAQKEPYIWDDEETITAAEMTDAMSARQTYLATVKQRADEYKAQKAAQGGSKAAPAASGGYDF
jgi:hypothetical protein